jgi:hypothetical protein
VSVSLSASMNLRACESASEYLALSALSRRRTCLLLLPHWTAVTPMKFDILGGGAGHGFVVDSY